MSFLKRWKKKLREKEAKLEQLPRLDDAIPKVNDPQCVAGYIKNDSAVDLIFVSNLETFHPRLIEAKEFLRFELAPGEKKLVPHGYFDILPHDVERKISWHTIGPEHPPVEFLYALRPNEVMQGAPPENPGA